MDQRRFPGVIILVALALPLPSALGQVEGSVKGGYAIVGLDRTGDGASADDPLFVHFGEGDRLGANDLRLTASACCARGTAVAAEEPDHGRTFYEVDVGVVTYAERDGRFGASGGDPLTLDLDETADVSTGDLRFGDGVRVTSGDPEAGRPLAPLDDGAFRLKHLDVDGDFYFDPPDLILLDVSRAAYAAPNDVALTASPSAPAGERLGAGSSLAEPTTRTSFLVTPELGYVDRGLDGPTSDDSYYLLFDRSGHVSEGAIRLAALGTAAAGTRVEPGDDETTVAQPVLSLPGAIGRARNPAARYDFESDFYVDADGSSAVTRGDFRLAMGPFAGFLSGTLVEERDEDSGRTLDRVSSRPPLKYVDANGDRLYDEGDRLYLDLTGRRVTTLGDVRIAVPGSPYASRVLEGDPDHVPVTRNDFAGAPRLMFWDVQAANGRLDVREPIFVHVGEGNESQPGDIRLTETGSSAAGTRVREGDGDADAPLTELDFSLAYRDGDGHPGLSGGRADVLYLDVAPTGRVSEGDVRITDARNATHPKLASGSRVLAQDPDVGRALNHLADDRFPVKYLDRNANERFDGDLAYPDVLYLDLTGAAIPAPGDVRLEAADLRGAILAAGTKVALGDPDAALGAYTRIFASPPGQLPSAVEEEEPEDELARLRRELEEAERDRTLTEEELDLLRARIAELEAERAEQRREARQWGPAAFALFGVGLVVLGASVAYFVRRRGEAERRAKRGGAASGGGGDAVDRSR